MIPVGVLDSKGYIPPQMLPDNRRTDFADLPQLSSEALIIYPFYETRPDLNSIPTATIGQDPGAKALSLANKLLWSQMSFQVSQPNPEIDDMVVKTYEAMSNVLKIMELTHFVWSQDMLLLEQEPLGLARTSLIELSEMALKGMIKVELVVSERLPTPSSQENQECDLAVIRAILSLTLYFHSKLDKGSTSKWALGKYLFILGHCQVDSINDPVFNIKARAIKAVQDVFGTGRPDCSFIWPIGPDGKRGKVSNYERGGWEKTIFGISHAGIEYKRNG
jgi:hypothetical protein